MPVKIKYFSNSVSANETILKHLKDDCGFIVVSANYGNMVVSINKNPYFIVYSPKDAEMSDVLDEFIDANSAVKCYAYINVDILPSN